MTDNSFKPFRESRLTQTQKSRFVLRAVQTHAPLLATTLTRYAEDEGITWEELAQSLQCTPEQFDSVAMCRPPRPESFAADVAGIADGYVETDRLLDLLRHLQVLDIFHTASSLQSADTPNRGVTLLAAQDRMPLPEPKIPETDSDLPSS